jgi:hypothetical protein
MLESSYGTGQQRAGTRIAIKCRSAVTFEEALIETDIDESRKIDVVQQSRYDLPYSSLHKRLGRNHPIPMQESQRKRPLAKISPMSPSLIPAMRSTKKIAMKRKATALVFNL